MTLECRDNYDVLQLLMTMYNGGGKDEYGKDVVPPIPLLFDRVNEGRPPTSNSWLFQLPLEILGQITRHLSESSLAALSLVSKDCCQLARSRRFASVQFNYSVPQSHLIDKLLEEVLERDANNDSCTSPSIGACFRRLQIATDAQWASYRLYLDRDELHAMDKEKKEKRLQEACSSYFGEYLRAIEIILECALPHLELLDVQDHIPLPRSFFIAVVCSTIQHLKLFRVTIREEFEVALPMWLTRRGWPLRTLHLELFWRIGGEGRGSTAPLCASLLHLCAPTLEKFTWMNVTCDEDEHSLVKQEPPCFARLRELTLEDIKFSDLATLKLLIFPQSNSQLKVLETDAHDDSLVMQFLESCGTIRSLETFVWNAVRLSPDQPLAFLRQNSQLSTLSISSFSHPPSLLDERILPILSQSYQDLKSLSLAWQGTSISKSALELIGTLRSLQQIHLSTGHQTGWRYNWFIKHQEMREHLRELPNLRKLAFSRDTYDGGWGFEDDYYAAKLISPDEIPEDLGGTDGLGRGRRIDRIWENQHRRRVLKEADEWVRVMPQLEWMYIGQIPMRVVVNADDAQSRHAAVLSPERDDCWTLLKRMFGREATAFD